MVLIRGNSIICRRFIFRSTCSEATVEADLPYMQQPARIYIGDNVNVFGRGMFIDYRIINVCTYSTYVTFVSIVIGVVSMDGLRRQGNAQQLHGAAQFHAVLHASDFEETSSLERLRTR